MNGIIFDLNEIDVPEDPEHKRLVSVIKDPIDLERYAADYYKKFFKSDTEIHSVVKKLPDSNTSTRIAVEDGRLRVTTHEYSPNEERLARRMFQGSLLRDIYVNIETGEIEVIRDAEVEAAEEAARIKEEEERKAAEAAAQAAKQQAQQTQPKPTAPQTDSAATNTQLPLKATCRDGTISYQDHPSLPNYSGMCSGHGGIAIRHGRVP